MCSSPKSGLALKPPSLLKVGLNLSNKVSHDVLRQNNENVELLQQHRNQQFKNEEPDFNQQIEVDKVRCPSHLLQFKQALNNLKPDQTLKVISSSAALIQDLAATSRILKLPVKVLRFRRKHFLYTTQTG